MLTAGAYSVIAIMYSSFARYLYVENLGLGMDEATVAAVTKLMPTDRGLLVIGAVMILLGLIAVATAILTRKRKPASTFTG